MIGVDKDGNVAMEYNSVGMFRGSFDSTGLNCSVGIWKDMINFDIEEKG